MPGIVMECRGEAGPEAWYPDAVQRATCVPLRNTKRGGGGGQDARTWGIKGEDETSIYSQAEVRETQRQIPSMLQGSMNL